MKRGLNQRCDEADSRALALLLRLYGQLIVHFNRSEPALYPPKDQTQHSKLVSYTGFPLVLTSAITASVSTALGGLDYRGAPTSAVAQHGPTAH